MFEAKSRYHMLFGFSAVAFYGLLVRLTFGAEAMEDYLQVLTVGFVCIGPFVFGFLTMALMPRKYKTEWVPSIFLPWVSCAIIIGAVLILAWEAWICVVMALPYFLTLSSLGGLLFCALARNRAKRREQSQSMMAVIFLLLPYMVGVVESRFPAVDSFHLVESQVIIDAPAEAVWNQITSVPQIQQDEQHLAAFRLAGVPKPMKAMMAGAGLGAVRHSAYGDRLWFVEEVSEWEPGQRYRFTIDLDPDGEPPWPWSMVDGAEFELIDGEYRIEPLNDHQVILHLNSRHRLTTKFNTYGGWWTTFLLDDIQTYILTVVKGRAERAVGL